MGEFFRRIKYLLNRRRFDRELSADMDFHRQMSGGSTTFGNSLRLREEAREAWGWTWIDRFFQDLRYALRAFRKAPGFTIAAVLMLAIGIGVNVAAFGFFNLMFLRPLPVRDPDTILRFQRRSPERYSTDMPYAEMTFIREHSRTLSAVLASFTNNVAVEGEAQKVNGHFVTANFFTELGAIAKLGRTLDPGVDAAPQAEPVAVLSSGFWERHYGSDPSIVGQTIRLNGKPALIIGVASREFSGLRPDSPDVWMPITQQPYFFSGSQLLTDFNGEGVNMWGRLQPGLAPRVAEQELRSLAAELRKQHPNDIWENESLRSEPGGYASSGLGGQSRGSGPGPNDPRQLNTIILVGALVLLILAVACGNLGSLLLARGVAREREIAIRVSVGAGKVRLIRQLFTESLLLALLGSIAGLALGYLVLRGLMTISGTPPWLNAAPDWRVILFALGIGFVAAILFGLTPALQLARQRHRATFVRQILIAAQVAGSCVLLIVAGLLMRAVDRAMSVNPGFEYQRVIAIDPALASHGCSPNAARAYLDTLRSRLRDSPGVESVSFASTPPLGGRVTTSSVEIAGRTTEIHINSVDPEFFQTMKIPFLRGRNLAPGDKQSVVISDSLARRLWPTQDPLGKPFDRDGAAHTVVGVVGSARMVALRDPDAVESYYLAAGEDLPFLSVVVSTTGPVDSVASSVASIARGVDPKVFPNIKVLKTAFSQQFQGLERSAMAVGVLGIAALLLACLGIVGLVAYAVSQRTKEIGIRMALGATPSAVLSIVLRQFSMPVFGGLIAGIGGAAALSQILRRELYGISNLDPLTYLAASGIFIATAALAALWPARQALRIDPIQALRHQ